MRGRDKARYALRVFIVALVVAAGLVLAFARVAGVADDELVRMLFWSGVLALFAAGMTPSFTFVRTPELLLGWLLAAATGGLIGILFCGLAMWPRGLWPGPAETPIYTIWPFAAGFGYFCAALGRYGSAGDADFTNFRIRSDGFLIAFLLVCLIKGGLSGVAALSFANAPRPSREIPLNERRSMARERVAATKCSDSLAWRSVLDPDVAMDSATGLYARGVYVTAGALGSPQRGRILSLWSAQGRWFGLLETWLGEDAPTRGLLEYGHEGRYTSQIEFRVPYDDGFVDRFNGIISDERIEGVLRTVDQDCGAHMLVDERPVFERNEQLSLAQAPQISQRELRRVNASIYARAVRAQTVLPEHKVALPVVSAQRDYYGEQNTALAVSAHFQNEQGLQRALDSLLVVDVKSNITLGSATIARAVDPAALWANWLVVLPLESAYAYRASLEQLRANGTVTRLESRLLPAVVTGLRSTIH